jgi:exosortase/archaeosortase family protein
VYKRIPEIAIGLQVVSLWPIMLWTARRSRDGSDEPWGLVALAALLVVAALSRKRAARQSSAAAPVATLAYALCLLRFAPLPCAVIGLFALALSLSRYLQGRALSFGILGLCWLSVPLLASLDFYLGYPLRWVTAEAATWLLHCSGFAVQRSGVSLVVDGAEIAVDPACSGIRMLWGTGLLISLLDCLRPLPLWRSLRNASLVFALLLLANTWRVAALFYLESGRIKGPHWLHDATGVAVFVMSLLAAIVVWQRTAPQQLDSVSATQSRDAFALPSAATWSLCAAASVALGASVLGAPPTTSKELSESEVAWPGEFEHQALVAQTPAPEVARFFRSFPGKVGFFRTGTQQLILRWVNEPTRRLHPAEHCYRANGYTVQPARQCVREGGTRYGCFIATRGNRSIRVSERIYDGHGREFTDVSSWYWAAILGRTQGPWHGVTIAETVMRTEVAATVP